MAYFFTPPTAPLVPPAPDPKHPSFPLLRHYRPWDAGINVWIVNGEVTVREPDRGTVTPDAEFLGGHVHTVTAEQAALLTAAGYTVVTV